MKQDIWANYFSFKIAHHSTIKLVHAKTNITSLPIRLFHNEIPDLISSPQCEFLINRCIEKKENTKKKLE